MTQLATNAAIAAVPVPAYSYDAIPYPSHPYEASHPDQIYSLVRLFKIDAKLPDEASVLELGCASGGNLIPMAVQMPNAKFVGVDLSTKQITEGQARIDALKIPNIQLVARDFREIDDSYGKFDYIVCHGVFSWVPPDTQNRILELCQQRLATNGIAYISYNAYPGWFMRGMIRQMMLHHIKNVDEPIAKVKQARALLAFLVESTEGQSTPYSQFLKSELEMLAKHSDAYLFHDHLEENNNPMFFYKFMEMVQSKGLQFVSESSLASMITSNLPAKAAEALTKLTNDLHQRSQYTDFVTNRMFRQSLLSLRDLRVVRHIDDRCLTGIYFSGNLRPQDESPTQELSSKVEVCFKCPNSRTITTANPALKALMYSLGDHWPKSLTLPELCHDVEQRLEKVTTLGQKEQLTIANVCASNILQMMVRGDVDFRYLPNRFTTVLSPKPVVTALARLQAREGTHITTQRHITMIADPLVRSVIQMLDGTRTKSDIVRLMSQWSREGKIKINIEGKAPKDFTSVYNAAIDRVFETLRTSAVLIA